MQEETNSIIKNKLLVLAEETKMWKLAKKIVEQTLRISWFRDVKKYITK